MQCMRRSRQAEVPTIWGSWPSPARSLGQLPKQGPPPLRGTILMSRTLGCPNGVRGTNPRKERCPGCNSVWFAGGYRVPVGVAVVVEGCWRGMHRRFDQPESCSRCPANQTLCSSKPEWLTARDRYSGIEIATLWHGLLEVGSGPIKSLKALCNGQADLVRLLRGCPGLVNHFRTLRRRDDRHCPERKVKQSSRSCQGLGR